MVFEVLVVLVVMLPNIIPRKSNIMRKGICVQQQDRRWNIPMVGVLKHQVMSILDWIFMLIVILVVVHIIHTFLDGIKNIIRSRTKFGKTVHHNATTMMMIFVVALPSMCISMGLMNGGVNVIFTMFG